MTATATLGTPCLVPVQVDAEGSTVRGFITRLSRSGAAVSTDPELPPGQRVTLRFRRPSDSEEVTISGSVSGLLPGGGLWRGRSAALVDLDSALDDEFFGAGGFNTDGPRRRGSEPQTDTPPARARPASFGGAFRAGLGRRRRPASAPTRLPGPPAGRRPSGSETGRRMAALSDAWAPVSGPDAEATAPPVSNSPEPEDAPLVPGAYFEEPLPLGAPSELDPPSGLLESGALPPVQTTHPDLAAAEIDPFQALVGSGESAVPDPVEDDFFGQFGRVQDLPEYDLSAVTGDDVPGTLSQMDPIGASDLPGTLTELEPLGGHQELPSQAPGLAADGYFDLAQRASAHADRPAETTFGDLLDTGAGRPPVMAPPGQAPPVQEQNLARSAAPWESEDKAGMSLIPRNARIASAIPVTFWARGRSNQATAQNFSKEGLFLATKDDPPVRGAIVRIEFPIEGEGAPVPVRFNAEVRWHQSDRPQSGLPEGFGVQILTFESPKDRVRYDELLLLILTLNADRDREEAKSFKWGRSEGGAT